jgi:hypothetical protein
MNNQAVLEAVRGQRLGDVVDYVNLPWHPANGL